MNWWRVGFEILPGDGSIIETEIVTQAASSRDAVLSASARLLMKPHERINAVHVSPPTLTNPAAE